MLNPQSHGEQPGAAKEAYAWHQLTIRCQDLERRLSAMSLITRRLSNEQLMELADTYLRPWEARTNLPSISWIEGANRLVRQAIEQDCRQVLDIYILPRQVVPGWFSQLMHIDEVMDISFFPLLQPSATTMQHIEKHSRAVLNQENDRYPDPGRVVAEADTERLMGHIAGRDRVLQFAMHVLIRGKGRREMYTRTKRVRAMLSRMQPGSHVASFEWEKGIHSCLHYTCHELWTNGHPRPFRSDEVSSIFPFLCQTPFELNSTLKSITCIGDPL